MEFSYKTYFILTLIFFTTAVECSAQFFDFLGEIDLVPVKGILPDRSNRLEDIYLRFYNGTTVEDYVDLPLSQASRLVEVKGFDKNSPTVLYMHGFIETATQESIQVVVNAYLDAKPGTNVVLLDWSNMSHGSYLINAARNTKKVGATTADNINALLEAGLALDKLHLIGHSLGSHVAGYTARELKNKYNKTVKRVTALDPAFPAFYPDGVMMEHVNAKDAEFVDVIHTDAGGYGAPVRTGTVDFWPNGGKSVQPGCPRFAPVPLSDDNLCSHWRSWRFYAESVRSPEAFPASPADSYHKFRENPTPETGMIYMGLNCDTSAEGNYYLTTNSASPFGKGLDGIYPKSKKKQTDKNNVGATTADNINALLEAGLALDKLHLIGHSLGSHVAGYTARELKNKYNKTVKRVTALDPAFPAFYPDGVMMEHVNAKDAEFVDVIHTDAGGYGAPVRTGTVDFWPNGGKSVQPGCPRFAPVPLSDDNLCSHWRSWRFYAESVRSPEAFPASPADSYHKFRENPTPETGMIYMGLNCDTSAEGNYYLTTNSASPFGKGLDGIYPKSKKKQTDKNNV